MKKKYTSLDIPVKLKKAVYNIIEVPGEPLFLFENQSIKRFIEQEKDVEDKFRNTRYASEDFIKRDAQMPVYINVELMERLDAYRIKLGTRKNNCIMQAFENSCKENAENLGLKIDLNYGEKND